MRHKINKYFNLAEYEKEEKWLNEMSSIGMHLVDVNFTKYTFEDGLPGEYIYRLELLEDMPRHPQSKAYIGFMEDMGVEYVASVFRWVYFRKRASDGPFDIYSDLSSKLRHIKRINLLASVVSYANAAVGVANLAIACKGYIEHRGYLGYNLFSGVLNIAIAFIILFILKPIRRKQKELQKESLVRE